MSDLQIGLAVIGALVIGVVIAYNRMQESRYRHRAEASFKQARGDALLEPGVAERAPRIEPMLSPGAGESADAVSDRVEPIGMPAVPEKPPAETPVSPIDYAIEVSCVHTIGRDSLRQLLDALGGLGKRVQVLAAAPGGEWIALANAPACVTRVRLALQLADRRGHVTQEDLAAFQRLVAQWAEGVGGSVQAPQLETYAHAARELDQFCADVDVVVGLNVVAANGDAFPGAKVRSCAEAIGFSLDEGAFRFADRSGATLFSLEHAQSGPLDPDRIKTSNINGITLLLDVPRLEYGVRAFDQMVETGRGLADGLGGALVDDNRSPVTEAGLEQIRTQLRQIYVAMEAKGIPAGSGIAKRLFS